MMAERFENVIALDLITPNVLHPRVQCHRGNAAEMTFAEGAFDFVFCAEVLEHVPTDLLRKICKEIERVACDAILIGVPYKQDIRVGRTTCQSCGKPNPPWGHVNSFDEERINRLFPSCDLAAVSFVGLSTSQTNRLSTVLMDFAGNPYGTYDQEEACIHCGQDLLLPRNRTLAQLIATKLAFYSRAATESFVKPHGNWIHLVLRKRSGDV